MNLQNSIQFVVIIGAQRSSTTSLLRYFQRCGAVVQRTNLNEPKWFLEHNNEIDHFRLDDYVHDVFDANQIARNSHLTLVEKSTSYYEYGRTAKSLKQFLGKPKVVVILRDPVERAISNYWFSRKNGIEFREIDEALLGELVLPQQDERGLYIVPTSESPMRMFSNPFNYLGRSRYDTLLLEWLQTFTHEDDFKVLEMNSFAHSREAQLELANSLGLDDCGSYFIENTGLVNEQVSDRVRRELRRELRDTYEWCSDFLGIRF